MGPRWGAGLGPSCPYLPPWDLSRSGIVARTWEIDWHFFCSNLGVRAPPPYGGLVCLSK